MSDNEIMVSVACATYNHEPYIKDAIEGFLMQKTTFPIEIIIHDDASTDKTAEIVQRYAEKNPDKIVPILQKNNQYSTGIGVYKTYIWPRVHGKYIAMCEGDDYWTDPNKLQKQVDFLEANPDYVVTYHNAITIDKKGNLITESRLPLECQRDCSGDELKKGFYTLTLTRLHRNIIKEFPKESIGFLGGDTFSTCMMGQYGKGKYMNDIKPSVYRSHPGGMWSQKSDSERAMLSMQLHNALLKYFKKLNDNEVAIFHKNMYYKYLISFLLNTIKTLNFSEILKACGLVFKNLLNIIFYYFFLKSIKIIYLKFISLISKKHSAQ